MVTVAAALGIWYVFWKGEGKLPSEVDRIPESKKNKKLNRGGGGTHGL